MITLFVVLAVACVLCLGVTTPTSYYGRLTGTEPWTDAVNFGSVAHVFGGNVIFNGAPVFAAGVQVKGYGLVTVAAATTTLTLDPTTHAGKLVLLQSTGGLAITPPAATGTGNRYDMVVITTVSGGNVTWDPKAGNASDVCAGALYGGTTGAAGSVWVTASNSNLVTLNGGTTGGLAGTHLIAIDVATNKWSIYGTVISSGTSATPFSNH